MKKIFTIGLLSLSCLAFAQTNKDVILKSKIKNSIAFEKGMLYEINDNKTINSVYESYKCLIKNYKYDIKQDSHFLNRKEFQKKYKEASIELVEKKAFTYILMMDFRNRENAVEKYPKCYKKEFINLE
ncbi:hypothetical protein [Soonwooa purpurea]